MSTYEMDKPQTLTVDAPDYRVRLMESFVHMEAQKAKAEAAAKEACASAAEISDAFARVRAELHEALGVSEMSRGEDSISRAVRNTAY